MIEFCDGINIGGRKIDEFVKNLLRNMEPQPKERTINEWIQNAFQPRYKIDPSEDDDWFFDGKLLPEITVAKIREFIDTFYKNLTTEVCRFVQSQSAKGKLMVNFFRSCSYY